MKRQRERERERGGERKRELGWLEHIHKMHDESITLEDFLSQNSRKKHYR